MIVLLHLEVQLHHIAPDWCVCASIFGTDPGCRPCLFGVWWLIKGLWRSLKTKRLGTAKAPHPSSLWVISVNKGPLPSSHFQALPPPLSLCSSRLQLLCILTSEPHSLIHLQFICIYRIIHKSIVLSWPPVILSLVRKCHTTINLIWQINKPLSPSL